MNIGRLAEDNIQRFAEYEFVNFEGRWHTNVEMNGMANKLGHALKSLGVKKGDRVGVQLPNCPQLIQTFFAVFKIGAILVPVNPTLRIHELAYIYQDAGVAALVSCADYIDRIRDARREATELKHPILIGKSVPKDVLSYDEMVQNDSDELVIEETDNDDTAVIIYTAGTTGNPKGVMLTHYNWYTHVTGYYESVLLDAWGVGAKGKIQKRDDGQDKMTVETAEVFGVARNRVSLIALPLFHGYGVFALSLEFMTGGKLVLISRWDTEEAMKRIEQFKITEFRGVPTMYIQMLNHPAASKYDLSSLKTCICGLPLRA